LPYALEIAEKGLKQAASEHIALKRGINIHDGQICIKEVALAQGKDWQEFPC
jgi:alanine dehydrogenase